MKVKDFLPIVKASKYTFYNLDNKTKKDFQSRYNHLKQFSDKEISEVGEYKIKQILANIAVDYIKKYYAIHEIRTNIVF